jgi:hypothetical protein
MNRKWNRDSIKALIEARDAYTGTTAEYLSSIKMCQSQFYRLKKQHESKAAAPKNISPQVIQLIPGQDVNDCVAELSFPTGHVLKIRGRDIERNISALTKLLEISPCCS